MRWGVRDEATDDHVTTGLCLQEIDNCQRLSVGPNFCVSLLRIQLAVTGILMPNTHRRRRRDATVELCRVGVGGVY